MAKLDLNQNKNEVKLTKEKKEKLGIPDGAFLKVIIGEDETKYQVCIETEDETGVKKQIVLKTLTDLEI